MKNNSIYDRYEIKYKNPRCLKLAEVQFSRNGPEKDQDGTIEISWGIGLYQIKKLGI